MSFQSLTDDGSSCRCPADNELNLFHQCGAKTVSSRDPIGLWLGPHWSEGVDGLGPYGSPMSWMKDGPEASASWASTNDFSLIRTAAESH